MAFEHERVLTLVEGREEQSYQIDTLVEAAQSLGWKVAIIRSLGSDRIAENKLDEVFSDYVLMRDFTVNDDYEIERVLFYLNNSDKVTINTNPAGGRLVTSNKYFQHGVMMADKELAKHVLPSYEALSLKNLIRLIGDGKVSYPFCLKPRYGTLGEGIILIKSSADLAEYAGISEGDLALDNESVESVPEDKFSIMITEPYIESKYNWRVFVLDGKPLLVMRKTGSENEKDFHSRSSGVERENEEDEEIRNTLYDIAVRAAKISGLEYTGVDIIRNDETGDFYILETNICAVWENNVKGVTGVDVPLEIIKYFEQKYQEREGN